MKLINHIEAIIFDMDGLLLDTERIYRRVWQQAARQCGFELSDAQHTLLLGRGRKGALEVLKSLMPQGFDVERFTSIISELEEKIFRESELPIKAGCLDLLAYLDEIGLKRAVATSTAVEKARERLERAGLLHRFPVICGGDQVSKSKPEPDLFLFTATQLHVVPSECLVLEDSESGILAAQRAGMVPCMIPDLMQPSAEIRNIVFGVYPSLTDFHRVFALNFAQVA